MKEGDDAVKTVHYFAPKSVQEALKLLDEYDDKATVLAGGTDVVTQMHDGKFRPEVIVYIGNIGLGGIEDKDGQIVLGALTKIAAVADSPLLKKKVPMLSEAASTLGNPMTRNKGTVGGNIMGASPAADVACCLTAMDGVLTFASVKGERKVKLSDFFEGYRQTNRKANELLTEISIPSIKTGSFIKLGRRKAATCSLVTVACTLLVDKGGVCEKVCIAMGSMGPTTVRATKAEKLLKGKKVTDALIGQAAEEAVKETQPIDDGRGSAWYRRKLAHALLERALKQSNSKGGDV